MERTFTLSTGLYNHYEAMLLLDAAQLGARYGIHSSGVVTVETEDEATFARAVRFTSAENLAAMDAITTPLLADKVSRRTATRQANKLVESIRTAA